MDRHLDDHPYDIWEASLLMTGLSHLRSQRFSVSGTEMQEIKQMCMLTLTIKNKTRGKSKAMIKWMGREMH